jgi:lipopolysaccharide export system permease protein
VKKLHIFILKSFTGPLVMTFFISLVILLMQFMWRYVDDLVGKGLTFSTIMQLMMWASCSLIPMALPLAILLAALMTFGNLGENYELLAMKSAGISLVRIMRPLIVLVAGLCIFAFFFANNVLPYANLKMRSLLYDIQQSRPELQIREGIFYNGIDNYSIKIGSKDQKTSKLRDVYIYDHSNNQGNTSVTWADSGYVHVTDDKRYLVMTLYNGYSYSDMPNQRRNSYTETYPFRRDRFDKEEVNIELSGFGLQRTDENLFKSNMQMLNLKQLMSAADSIKVKINNEHKEFHRQVVYAQPFRTYRHYGPTVPDTAKKDSIKKKVFTVNVDSLFKTMSQSDKMQVYSRALDEARSTSGTLETQKLFQYSRNKRLNKHYIEWHRKFTLSLACIIFFFIGAPFGAIVRKGGLGMPVVISVIFFILYYMISLSGEKFVKESVLPGWQGMWISTVILLPLGVYLTYKATHDSPLMNIEIYMNTIQKWLFPKAYKKKLQQEQDNKTKEN